MKTITTTVAVLLAAILMTACGKKESAAPAEAAPAATPATPAAQANDEDASQTGGDKVAPRSNDVPQPPSN